MTTLRPKTARRMGGDSDPVAQLRAVLTDAALAGIWSREGVRLCSAGTVSAVDDARCTTTTGRYIVPGTNGNVALGNLVPLNGLGQLTIMAWITCPRFDVGFPPIFGRSSDGLNATQQFCFRINNADGKLAVVYSDGVTPLFPSGTTALVPGNTYKVAVVFDGSLLAASRFKFFISQRAADGSYPAATVDASPGGAATYATLLTHANVLAYLGSFAAGGNAFGGAIDELRVWAGTALSQAQVDAETLTANPVAASLRYDGTSYANLGTLGATYNATPGTATALGSDDLFWGPTLVGPGGAGNPTWDVTNRDVVFDGAAQYLRAIGGSLSLLTSSFGLATITALPVAFATDQRLCELGDAAAGGASVFLQQVATGTGNISAIDGVAAAGIPAPASATSYPGQRVVHSRRTDAGGGNLTMGAQLGALAEGTTTSAQALTTPVALVVGAARTGTVNFAAMRWRGLVLHRGDYAGKQATVNTIGSWLGATL